MACFASVTGRGREKGDAFALRLQNLSQGGLRGRRRELLLGHPAVPVPGKQSSRGRTPCCIGTPWCANEMGVCRAKRAAQSHTPHKWDCCGECSVSC